MNRLKKILLSFVLPFFCLFISVSYAGIIQPNITYNSGMNAAANKPTGTESVNIFSDLNSFDSDWKNKIRYFLTSDTHDSYIAWWNDTLLPFIYSTYNKDSYLLYGDNLYSDSSYLYYIFFYNSNDIDFAIDKFSGESYADAKLYNYVTTGDNLIYFKLSWAKNGSNFSSDTYSYTFTQDCFWTLAQNTWTINGDCYFLYGGSSIKTMINNIWDGSSYYYKYSNSGSEEDTPSLPSNAEIAQAVQAFYNSDYYKNNKEFEDFMVLYSYETGYFSFIGHNFGIDLGQVIVPPNYEYEGYSYNQDWWKFFLRNISAEISSNLWNRYYWLYLTNDFGENIAYSGKGFIKDLINLHFSTNSIIVYSTIDYPVVKIETNEETGVLEPVEGTIPGDQYTYDETLDPTTNEYNPLETIVPTNPTQSILGDVDFDEINKTFEENKNILDIENASWLFTANNQLFYYFSGFILFLIVLIIISRLLGG